MTEKRISLGINVSILLILMIFAVLLSLPLKLLFNTSYDDAREQETDGSRADKIFNETSIAADNSNNNSSNNNSNVAINTKRDEISVLSIDFRKIKRCRNYRYEDCMKSILYSDYDRNCTYYVSQRKPVSIGEDKGDDDESMVGAVDEEKEPREPRNNKAVAGHILVTMLLISAIAALIEVVRIRFCKDKSKRLKGRISLTKE